MKKKKKKKKMYEHLLWPIQKQAISEFNSILYLAKELFYIVAHGHGKCP